MNTKRSIKWGLVTAAATVRSMLAAGCELLVDFDRSKIPQEGGLEDVTSGDGPEGDSMGSRQHDAGDERGRLQPDRRLQHEPGFRYGLELEHGLLQRRHRHAHGLEHGLGLHERCQRFWAPGERRKLHGRRPVHVGGVRNDRLGALLLGRVHHHGHLRRDELRHHGRLRLPDEQHLVRNGLVLGQHAHAGRLLAAAPAPALRAPGPRARAASSAPAGRPARPRALATPTAPPLRLLPRIPAAAARAWPS